MFFLLLFHLLDSLKIAAWPSSSLVLWPSECAEAKCDSIMGFNDPVQQSSAIRRQRNANRCHYCNEPHALASLMES